MRTATSRWPMAMCTSAWNVSARESFGSFARTNRVCSATAVRFSRSRYACVRSSRSERLLGSRCTAAWSCAIAGSEAACCGGCCCCSRGVDDCITKYPSAASAAKEAKPQRKPFTVGLIEEVLGAGCWVLGAGCWVLGAGCWALGAGCWVLGAGCWVTQHSALCTQHSALLKGAPIREHELSRSAVADRRRKLCRLDLALREKRQRLVACRIRHDFRPRDVPAHVHVRVDHDDAVSAGIGERQRRRLDECEIRICRTTCRLLFPRAS